MTDRDDTASTHHHHAIHIFGRRFQMPRSRVLRVLIGVLLIILGILGFLPVLGFWMIPLGLLVLSYEFHLVRRLRRRTLVWWERRQRAKAGK
ncbi:Putative transmembrane protein (PGPGW) [Mesorhizobium albiziae]|uniref:Transmembrane protein (PGPGW) n=1 Tax=Neomesorhizobium albiziae TaxID=335020 RepID=A0A1I4AGZ8_9HYPH|nr:PGPGW domain-containing protein [Mesorhizobium albiziae]SFK55755.1 Putative transmembrane protein (PGPGW) [Mesorhizobium albiziae]